MTKEEDVMDQMRHYDLYSTNVNADAELERLKKQFPAIWKKYLRLKKIASLFA